MLPILFQSNGLILFSYPLLMGIGWGVAYQVYFNRTPSNLSRKNAMLIFWGIFLSAWIGSKLFFYLTLPSHLSQNMLSEFSFWTGGGFVFYGGLLAGIVFLLFLNKYRFKLTEEVLWPILPAMTFGHGIGRIGCALAGCCYGAATDWIWGIEQHGQHRHPTQLIEATALILMGLYFLKSKKLKFDLISQYFIIYGVLRFIIEILRDDEVRGLWGPLTPSQWISMGLILLGVWRYCTKKVKFTAT
jgi:phosphatidylglycerol---prolipoprotein diacylglyceryl transferase